MAPCSPRSPTTSRSIREVSDMIETSLIVDADLLNEETNFVNDPPTTEHSFDALNADQTPVHEPPEHVCEELTVQVPKETLHVLTKVFEQVQALQASSEQADALSASLSAQPDISKYSRDSELSSMISTEGSLCSSRKSSDFSIDVPCSPGLSSDQ